MKEVCWPYYDPEFDSLPERLYGPICRAMIDNESMEECTVIKVDGLNKHDLLLGLVQVLTDLNLHIVKGYVSSDAGWFMDVFHVKDEQGNKITDKTLINHIQQGISTDHSGMGSSSGDSTPLDSLSPSWKTNLTRPKPHHSLSPTITEPTAIEITGADRPGLFSEISAALADLGCNVVEAHAWFHNDRLACVAHISDTATPTPLSDRLPGIQDHLSTVLRGTTIPLPADAPHDAVKASSDHVSGMISDVERRLHQLMHSARDFEDSSSSSSLSSPWSSPPRSSSAWSSPRSSLSLSSPRRSTSSTVEEMGMVSSRKARVKVESCAEKGYSIVTLESKDRQRLMFDTVCTLNDLQYVIFHASVSSRDGFAFQEYFIRHVDGCPLSTQSEKDRVTKCLEAAIERRVCEGLKLELCANNRIGLLSDITRVLRENGLAVVRADVATEGEKAINAFYVRDLSGKDIDMEFLESVKREMGSPISVQVKNEPALESSSPERCRLSLGEMLRSHIGRISHSLMH